jgi:uncharacterized membrane protein
MPLWLIPLTYTIGSVAAGLVLPRLERVYLAAYTHDMSVASALALFSAVSSGMMALTGIVFAIAFVVVQFSAVAYSPRLVTLFAGNSTLYHTLGVFFATFAYALAALIWTDRGGSGTVPLFSTLLVMVLLIVSMLAFARLIQSLNDLQIHNVLQVVGKHGRAVIRTMFPPIAGNAAAPPAPPAPPRDLGPATQTLIHSGEPGVVARFDVDALVRLAQRVDGAIAIECGVGETLVEDTVILHVYRATQALPERALRRGIRLATARTFEQDPKYALRLLVDIAIRALSPAINDPTTAVQSLDQIEDLLHRLGRRQLDTGNAYDASGTLRLTFPLPTWEDYLDLSFDEIRQCGATSLQVMRRMRAVLVGLSETLTVESRRAAVRQHLDHLDLGIELSEFDVRDQETALQEDRQGLGLSRRRRGPESAPAGAGSHPVTPAA